MLAFYPVTSGLRKIPLMSSSPSIIDEVLGPFRKVKEHETIAIILHGVDAITAASLELSQTVISVPLQCTINVPGRFLTFSTEADFNQDAGYS